MTTFLSHLKSVVFILIASSVAVQTAQAQVPSTIGFQGLLTDENGAPLPSGDYSISFRIYTSEGGGTALWTEVQSVAVVDGVANATLGRINPLDLPFDVQYWLGLTIGQSSSELSPRLIISAVAYSLSAKTVEDGSITESKIGEGAVTTAKLAEGAVETAAIADAAVSLTKISTGGAVNGQTLVFDQGQLVWGAPSGEGVISQVEAGAGLEGGGTTGSVSLSVAAEGITSTMLGAGAVTSQKLGDLAVTEGKIENGAVTAPKIPNGELPLNKLNTTGASASQVVTFNGSTPVWSALNLADGSVETADLADGAVTGPKISSTGASASDILTFDGANVLWAPAAGVGPGTIGTDELADAAVTAPKLRDSAVTAVKLAPLAVGESKIADAAVTTTKVADAAVTTSKIADSSVSTAKLVDGSVGTGKLALGAVTSDQIAASAVNLSKIDPTEGLDTQVLTISGNAVIWSDPAGLGPGSVGEIELADNSVGASKIKTGAVTTGKINDAAVGNAALADGAVTNVKIAPTTILLDRINVDASSQGDFLVVNAGALNFANVFPSSIQVGTDGQNANLTIKGDVDISGSITKGSGTFKIDHPLDPENKYLYHSFVESDEMLNVYSGNAELDADGRALVRLPDWFESANKDYRYQLTCIGGYSPVYIEREIVDGDFVIGGGTPGLRVSWQITAVRDDPYARKKRVKVEVDKPASERGSYLHPEAYE
jgi:hypothetical protein